jgi:hypothetical protein
VYNIIAKTDNLRNFYKTGWGFVNGVADYESNKAHNRGIQHKMVRFLEGATLLQKAVELVLNA